MGKKLFYVKIHIIFLVGRWAAQVGLRKIHSKRDMNVNAVSWGYSWIRGLEHLLEFLGPGKDLITEGRPQASCTELITRACEVQICLRADNRNPSENPANYSRPCNTGGETPLRCSRGGRVVHSSFLRSASTLSPRKQHAVPQSARGSRPPLGLNHSLSVVRANERSWKTMKVARRSRVQVLNHQNWRFSHHVPPSVPGHPDPRPNHGSAQGTAATGST